MRVSYGFHIERIARRPKMKEGTGPLVEPTGRVPRVTRLMALALHFEQLLLSGEVEDYASLARLGHVTRARMTQIMNLLNLAPDIQEELLFLPLTRYGRDPFTIMQLQPIALTPLWPKQRKLWIALKSRANSGCNG